MHDFTPVSALSGGLIIGVAASLLLIGSGRVAGISGILGGPRGSRSDTLWRVLFMLGLLIPGIFAAVFAPEAISGSPRSLGVLAVAGLLVGAGTRLGGGCTSGHGVCGTSRLSPRSFVATLTFIAAGMVVVRLLAAVGGAS